MPELSPQFDLKKFNFNFDLSKANYEIDVLQNRMLEFYIRNDPRFRQAFHINYTTDFLQYIKDKARLREPVHISVIGNTRSGKSYSAISLCFLHQLFYKRWFDIKYVCANKFEFIDKLQNFKEEDLKNRIFLIDEDKQAIYGVGSISRKMKITDVQNIIAINNISTIMLQPIEWANRDASYGLRTFGRCFGTKTVRMMLYNLMEKGRGGSLPMGNIYIPIFTSLLSKDLVIPFEKAYLEKKQNWVNAEMRGDMDVIGTLHKKTAEDLMKDDIFLSLKKRGEKKVYIKQRLGSEWTNTEIETLLSLTDMMRKGVSLD